MRIAYVALHLQKVIMQGGVGQKIAAQMKIWQEMGHSCHFFLHTPDNVRYPDTTIFPYGGFSQNRLIQHVTRELPRSLSLHNMIRRIEIYRPDIIYLRYGLFTYPLQRLFDIAPVAVEINGDDINEYRHRGTIFYLVNKYTRRITLQKASALVHASQEVADLSSNTCYGKPSIVIANGIDMREYSPLPAPSNDKPRLSLVCSAGYNWHGVDKLIWLAQQFPDLSFDIIGHKLNSTEINSSNVNNHGFLSKEKVREVLKYSDVACGTLALHRKCMEEASPLKVRESLAYGIPTILAYQDTDLSNLDFDFILNIPNREDNVSSNAERIRSFAYDMMGKRARRETIQPYIDQSIKEEKRLAFFDQIITENG